MSFIKYDRFRPMIKSDFKYHAAGRYYLFESEIVMLNRGSSNPVSYDF